MESGGRLRRPRPRVGQQGFSTPCLHSYASAERDANIDWKALSERIGHSDVAFTMRQYVQTDLEVHRQAATALAGLILAGVVPAPEFSAARGDGPDATA